MKKIFLIIFFLVTIIISYSQPKNSNKIVDESLSQKELFNSFYDTKIEKDKKEILNKIKDLSYICAIAGDINLNPNTREAAFYKIGNNENILAALLLTEKRDKLAVDLLTKIDCNFYLIILSEYAELPYIQEKAKKKYLQNLFNKNFTNNLTTEKGLLEFNKNVKDKTIVENIPFDEIQMLLIAEEAKVINHESIIAEGKSELIYFISRFENVSSAISDVGLLSIGSKYLNALMTKGLLSPEEIRSLTYLLASDSFKAYINNMKDNKAIDLCIVYDNYLNFFEKANTCMSDSKSKFYDESFKERYESFKSLKDLKK